MDETRICKQMDFILEIDKAKNIIRQTYLSDGVRKENDAEHSWHTAIMAFVLAEYFDKNIDVLKVMKMMLMHDIIEIDAGDTYCYDEKAALTQADRERKAAERIYSLLPEDQAREYMDLWLEFEGKETPESKYCAILDRLQPSVLNYANKGVSWKEHGVCFGQVMGRNAVTLNGPEEISSYFKNLIDNAVENGYLKK